MKKYLVAAFLFMFGFAVAHIVIAQEEGNTTTNEIGNTTNSEENTENNNEEMNEEAPTGSGTVEAK